MTTRATVRPARRRPSWLGSAILLAGAVYCLLPIAWVVAASTKNGSDLFTTFTFAPGTGFVENLSDLSEGGLYWRWLGNTALYARRRAALRAGLRHLRIHIGQVPVRRADAIFNVLLAGVLVPGITLAIPQYLLLAEPG